MDTLQKLKDAFRGTFYKDLARFEPGAQGLAFGDNVRIRVKGEALEVSWLAGTPPGQRKLYVDRLAAAGLAYTEGKDFRL